MKGTTQRCWCATDVQLSSIDMQYCAWKVCLKLVTHMVMKGTTRQCWCAIVHTAWIRCYSSLFCVSRNIFDVACKVKVLCSVSLSCNRQDPERHKYANHWNLHNFCAHEMCISIERCLKNEHCMMVRFWSLFTEQSIGSSECAQAGRRGEGLAVPGGAGYELVHYTGSPT